MNPDAAAVRNVQDRWAEATRDGRQDGVLAHHQDDLLIFAVLSPLRYTSAAQYRESWEPWQPDARGAVPFALQDLAVEAGAGVGYAFGLRQCDGQWKVARQHVSQPMERG